MSSHSEAVLDDPSGPPRPHHMDVPTAYSAAKLGMWLFLATEVLLFSVMFTGFAIYRFSNLQQFHAASHHLNWWLGAINTIVLLASSYTAALAVDAAQHSNNKAVIKYLFITLICAGGFLGIKTIEYSEKFEARIFPGQEQFADGVKNTFFKKDGAPAFEFTEATKGKFPAESIDSEKVHHYCGTKDLDTCVRSFNLFYGLYFSMTGLHALHVIIGMGVIGWIIAKARRNRFSNRYYTPVEVGALYWHLVDLIWIYLFPLLYLVG